MSDAVPEGWNAVSLGDLCTFSGGSAFKEKYQGKKYQGKRNGEYPFIKVSDMNLEGNERFITKAVNWLDEETLAEAKVKLFPAKSVVFAKVGAALLLNRRRILTRKTAIDNNMMAAIPNDDDDNFLYYVLQDVDLGEIVQGGALPSVNQSQIRDIPALIPPLPEQQKIAAILSSVDEVIEKTRAQIDKLKDLKTAMMQELVTKGIGHTEFKDSPVGRIPGGWDIQPLIKFSLGERNSFVNGPFGSDLLASELTKTGVPVIYVRDLKGAKYNRVSKVCVTEEKADALPACNVVKGDVLVAKVGDPPCGSGVYESEIRSIVTQDVIRIRPNLCIDPYFLAYLLNSPLGRKQIEKIEIAGTRKRVSLTEFKGLFFPMPAHHEQVWIGKIIRSIDQRIDEAERKNSSHKNVKKALMQVLLTGKVRVNVEQEEPVMA